MPRKAAHYHIVQTAETGLNNVTMQCYDSFMNMNVRAIAPSEWQAFRDFRLVALKSAPGAYETTYAHAAARSEDDWRSLLSPERQQMFGLFDGDRLIGITAVFTSREDVTTAMLAMSFILPEYRGKRLSRLLYEARLDWVRERGTFRRVVVGHRASNKASEGAMRTAGFQPTHREPRTWPDGVTEDEIWYELRLDQR
jgi:RimJ/RimL family protein N-acetyltransferase